MSIVQILVKLQCYPFLIFRDIHPSSYIANDGKICYAINFSNGITFGLQLQREITKRQRRLSGLRERASK